ncbi:hypothetical protein HPP92_005631 [Vanilla planifolia]|uniref:Uncharacterized protein n=1 Tax=Vanilla planifolia TaxID=51239 RepID=A0A835VCD0_VANPL|nr:hypothetical protein HPP92_005631 [Vanilla planifolia]
MSLCGSFAGGSRSFRVMKSFQGGLQGGMATAFPSPVTFPSLCYPTGESYNVYGYSPYSPDYNYPTAYYNVYGGGTAQYPLYGGNTACNGMATGTNAFYPYFQFGHGQTGYGLQYPAAVPILKHEFHGWTYRICRSAVWSYTIVSGTKHPSSSCRHDNGSPAPSLPTPAANHYSLIPSQFSTASSASNLGLTMVNLLRLCSLRASAPCCLSVHPTNETNHSKTFSLDWRLNLKSVGMELVL